LVERKKNITSVHFSTFLIDSAYAAGTASSSTSTVDSTLAVSEFSSGGHGLVPVEAPKNSRYPCRVKGANRDGGLVAASASLWNEVSSIHRIGSTKMMPMTQASRPRKMPPRGLRSARGLPVPARTAGRVSVTELIVRLPLGTRSTPFAGRRWR
jgi:hypothetical protein